MIRSMTAFSRLSVPVDEGLITLEIQSLNRKHLEIMTLLPREFLEFDSLIKKQIQKQLSRGKVQFILSFVPHAESQGIHVLPNLPLAKEIQKGWRSICEHLNLQEQERGLVQLLIKESKLFETNVSQNFTKTIEKPLLELVEKALDRLVLMREKEGAFLKEELEKRVAHLKDALEQVEELSQNASKELQEKLHERLDKLLEGKIEKDERFFREVALLADKADITEEITRLHSHLKAFTRTLNKVQKGHGKLLDFISQELNREWNTIGAKCSLHEISTLVLQAKSECEKIREQIHNIE